MKKREYMLKLKDNERIFLDVYCLGVKINIKIIAVEFSFLSEYLVAS